MKMCKIYSFKRKLLVIAGSFLLIISGYSESLRNSATSDDSITISPDSIPELGFFINSAIIYSPLLASTVEEIAKVREAIKVEKKSWLNHFYLEGNARYGLFNQLTLTEQSGSVDLDATLSNNTQFNYYGGISIRIPFADVINRGNRLKILRSDISISEKKLQNLRNEITRIIVEEYYALKSSQEIFRTYQDIMHTVNINYLKAKSELSTGIINMNQFSDIMESKGKVEEIYVKSKNEYLSNYFKLLVLAGIELK